MNNRQNGRRRGRGGVRPPNGGNLGNDRGSRIDNRSRGNASQLYEKYRTLARDAQTQGDRVMTEYYLQFADHYFRVLNENRPRFEEQQRRTRDDNFDEDFDGEADAEADGGEDQRDDQRAAAPRQDRQEPRYERNADQPREAREPGEYREPREPRPPREERHADRASEGEANGHAAANGEPRPRRGRRPFEGAGEQPRLELDRLPPAIARAPESSEPAAAADAADGGDAPPPRTRRPRRPRSSEGTIAVEA